MGILKSDYKKLNDIMTINISGFMYEPGIRKLDYCNTFTNYDLFEDELKDCNPYIDCPQMPIIPFIFSIERE